MTDEPIKYGTRKHFESLLVQALKQTARKRLGEGGKAVPEIPSTFREGYKLALLVFGLITESTTELNDKQMDIMCKKLDKILGNTPPPPTQ
tara:strand:- start:4086 stop:4358 length:273 start_codon:yes stop_codon:yes gene_type:complete